MRALTSKGAEALRIHPSHETALKGSAMALFGQDSAGNREKKHVAKAMRDLTANA